MPTQQVVNNTSTQTTLTTTAGTVTTSPITQTVNGYSTLKTSIPFFSASMVGGIITVHNPEIPTIGQTAGKDDLAYPASQIGEITNVYSSFSGQTRKLSGSYDFSILMVQNSTTARVAQVGGFKNSDDDTLGSFNVLLAKKPDGDVQWTDPPTIIDYYDTYIVNSFSATNNFTASYIQPLVVTQTENSSSFADIILSNIEPATGDVYKVKTLYKPSGQFGDFIDLGDTILERQDILIDTQSFETGVTVGSYYENFGVFENLEEIQTYWSGSKIGGWQAGTDLNIMYDMDTLMGGARLKPGDLSFGAVQAAEFTMKPQYSQRVYKDTEYIVTFNIANDPDITDYSHNTTGFGDPRLDIYVSGSKIIRSEDSFLNVLANGASLPSNFNFTFNSSLLKQIDGPLGTRIGTYITKPIPETVTSCAFRFKALEDASINLKFVIRYGAFIISDIHVYANKETGYSPNYVRISKRIPTEHLNTPLTFKFQYFDRFGRQANLESVAYGAVFDGDNTYIDGTNNLLTGSVFISNQVGSGLELAGVNSGFMRSVGYDGFISASNPAKGGAPGWMIWSGSVLPSSGDNYGGVGLELIADADNYLQYRTYPQSIFIVKAESFFLGAPNNYISGSNGNLEISSSNFILARNGDVFVKGDINADTGTFKDVDIRGKIATFQVSGSSTSLTNSGISRVMLEPWFTGTASPGPGSTFYGLTTNTYVSQSIPNIKTRLPWYIPEYLWNPDTKTETISNRIQTASYGAVPAKQMDFEYNFSHDSTLYGITSGYPYDNGISFGYDKNITWNTSTGSWCGIRLQNVRITPASFANQEEMTAKADYVLMVGASVYVGVEFRIIIKRGTTTLTSYTYTDEFDTHEYVTRTGEHVTLRIPLGAQSSYRSTANGYNPVNPRVDIEIQWRNSGYSGATVPNPSTDVTARFIALHELKVLELPRVDNLAVRNLRIGDPFRSSVIFDVVGSNLIGTNGGAEPSMVTLRNTAFDVTQSKGYHDIKVRDLYSQRDTYISNALYVDNKKQFNHGGFSSSGSQSLPGANQSASLQFDTTDVADGVTYTNGSRIQFPNDGVYNIQFSAQLEVDTNASDIFIWLKKNGSNIDNTATRVHIDKANASYVAAWNWIYPFVNADYVEIAWQSTDANATLLAEPATGNVPAIPSVIVTVTQVA